ncbi:MAG: hypothetical protein ACOYM7_03745 [Paludibacter sp.]
MKRTIFFHLIVISVILIACNSKDNDENEADIRLNTIKELINDNKLNEAKTNIDSIHILFPRLVEKRKMAVALNDTIILRESYRTLKYSTQILPAIKHAYESILTDFRFEKNTKYTEAGKYVYKSQLTEQNTGRNYLRCEVFENNDVFLVSEYSGPKLNHFAIQAESSGFSAVSDTLKKGVLHTFTDGGRNYENLTFRNETDCGLTAFISEHYRLPIKITLIGSRKFTYQLAESDKLAINRSYTLSKARKLMVKTENDLRISQQRIGKINLLYK